MPYGTGPWGSNTIYAPSRRVGMCIRAAARAARGSRTADQGSPSNPGPDLPTRRARCVVRVILMVFAPFSVLLRVVLIRTATSLAVLRLARALLRLHCLRPGAAAPDQTGPALDPSTHLYFRRRDPSAALPPLAPVHVCRASLILCLRQELYPWRQRRSTPSAVDLLSPAEIGPPVVARATPWTMGLVVAGALVPSATSVSARPAPAAPCRSRPS